MGLRKAGRVFLAFLLAAFCVARYDVVCGTSFASGSCRFGSSSRGCHPQGNTSHSTDQGSTRTCCQNLAANSVAKDGGSSRGGNEQEFPRVRLRRASEWLDPTTATERPTFSQNTAVLGSAPPIFIRINSLLI